MEDDDAAVFEKGSVRGLSCVVSAGVDDPNGLGEGDGFDVGGAADGEGGSKSEIPNRCSEVNEGILSTSRSPGKGGAVSKLPLLSGRPNVQGFEGVCTVSMTGNDARRVMLGFLGIACTAASGPAELGVEVCHDGSPNGAADRDLITGGGVGSGPVGTGPGGWYRRPLVEASREPVNWWEVRDTVEMVETLACVGDTRLWVRVTGADNGGGVDG